jgi:APA family basic amino acid/polyamine antiporter
LTLLLIKGTSESATVNAVIVAVKVTIVVMIIGLGWKFINPVNHTPLLIPDNFDAAHVGFFRHGWGGVIGGAGIVFFAFIGFDAVSTAAQEAINPGRDMPIGLLGSLTVCTVLYIAFSWVLTGIAKWNDFNNPALGGEASVAYAIKTGMPGYSWLATFVTIAILFGFSSVMLVMLLGQSRVFYSMANDGLLPRLFAEVHPVFVGLIGALLPGDITGNLTSIGTLFAFVLVSIGVWIMRRTNPGAPRPFRTPLVPLVPILGALVCFGMIYALDTETQVAAGVWMLIGLVVYFLYAKGHSKLNQQEVGTGVAPGAIR